MYERRRGRKREDSYAKCKMNKLWNFEFYDRVVKFEKSWALPFDRKISFEHRKLYHLLKSLLFTYRKNQRYSVLCKQYHVHFTG